MADFLIQFHLRFHCFFLFFGKLGQIELVSEVAGQGNIAPDIKRCESADLMVRNRGHMRSHRADGIHDAGSILDLQAGNRNGRA
jgi:hypothetical protein